MDDFLDGLLVGGWGYPLGGLLSRFRYPVVLLVGVFLD